MPARRESFADAIVEVVTRLIGSRLEDLAACLADSVARLCEARGIEAAAVAIFDARTDSFEVELAIRGNALHSGRHLLPRRQLAPLLDRLEGDDVLMLPGAADTLEPAGLRLFLDVPADARIFVPLPHGGEEPPGFLHVATERGSADEPPPDAGETGALLAALRPVVTQALQRKRAWECLREVADTGAIAAGGTVFDWAVHLLAAALKADIAFVGRVNLDFSATVTTLAACDERRTIGNFSHPLAPRPLERRQRSDPRYPPRARDGLAGAPRPPCRDEELRPTDDWLRGAGLESWFGVSLRGTGGQVLGVIAVMFRTPRTDRERIEATLRIVSERVGSELRRLVAEEEKAGLSAVVEAMTDLVATVRPSGYVTHLNPAGRRMIGLPDGADASALTLATLLSVKPEAESLALHVLDDADARGSWSENGMLLPIDGGGSIDVTRLALPIRDGQGRTTSYVVVIRDISERKAQEAQLLKTIAALAQSESLLEGVVNNSSSLIYVKDPEGVYLLASDRFLEVTGLARDEILGRSDAELFPADVAPRFRASDLWVLEGGEAVQGEDRHDGPLGTRIFLTTKFPLRDTAGRIYAVCGISTDITERKRAEQENRELEAKLRQAQRMESIGQLSGGIAHDFNNILAAIVGYTELAQMDAAGDEAMRELLDGILSAALRARDLVAQLLAFSRRSEPPAEPVAVAPVVKEVAKLLRSTLPATIHIAVEIADFLPSVRISPVQLHQVLMNLAINARDAMNGPGRLLMEACAVALTERATCASCHHDFQGHFVRFTVADEGKGITPDDLPRLFDPFFTTKEVGRGTGLGLSVLHGIVHSAGGHVEVESRPGAGSTFRIYLPALPSGAAAAPPPGRPRRETPALTARVMVVDDEAQIVAWLCQLFEGLGCTVAGFTDPRAALARFDEAPEGFDLLVTDQTMPGVTGVELARAALRRRPGLPVILCSGYLSETVEDGARAAGIRTLLEKPVSVAALVEAARNALC